MLHEPDYEMRFGVEVREAREARGWSQGALARELTEKIGVNIDQSGIARIEAGKRALRFSEAIALSRVLTISIGAYITFSHLSEADYEKAKEQVGAADESVEQAAARIVEIRATYHDEEARAQSQYAARRMERGRLYASIREYEDRVGVPDDQRLTDPRLPVMQPPAPPPLS